MNGPRLEPNDVLQQFLASINPPNADRDNSGRTTATLFRLSESNFASNGVMELFGRTIRGSKKIHQYYRFVFILLCLYCASALTIIPFAHRNRLYKHRFENAISCEPFENRPTHMETYVFVCLFIFF